MIARSRPRERFLALLGEMVRRRASDLHLTEGERPRLRIDGAIVESTAEAALAPEEAREIVDAILAGSAASDSIPVDAVRVEERRRCFEDHGEVDISFGVPDFARFRANLYRQQGRIAMAIRRVPFVAPSLDELGLPPSVAGFAERPRGLVLVTGTTGSGKSTTLAAMIDKINRERRGHILTIEDPIEFVHEPRGCLISQREVGVDTRSFETALRSALRQAPDVILVGEMRDLETIQAALTIAETGHLCLATLHTNSAVESVSRMIDVFPAHQQGQVRAQLAFVLEGVVTQTLLPRAGGGNRRAAVAPESLRQRTPLQMGSCSSGSFGRAGASEDESRSGLPLPPASVEGGGAGRLCASEIMISTPAVRACIREGRLHQLYSHLQTGKKLGMQTLNDALFDLYSRGEVRLEECLRASRDPAELLRLVKGPN